eukprot:COSAG02_NODE_67_length_42609_cov_14.506681_22_plen_49_part_00
MAESFRLCLRAGGEISVRDIQLLQSQPPKGCEGRAEACTRTASLYKLK